MDKAKLDREKEQAGYNVDWNIQKAGERRRRGLDREGSELFDESFTTSRAFKPVKT